MSYTMLADVVVAVHFAFMAFVVLAQVVILGCFRYGWVRNRWFRGTHLASIGVVIFESLLGITCPLTSLEDYLRTLDGTKTEGASFVGRLFHNWLFYDASESIFTVIYVVFGMVVLGSLILVPPKWRKHERAGIPEQACKA